MDEKKHPDIKALEKSLGATAEMALIFMRAAMGAGATAEEGNRLTQAYIAALLFGRTGRTKKPEDE